MALEMTTTKEVFGQTLIFEKAYFKIGSLRGSKDSLVIFVEGFDTKEKLLSVFQREYTFTPSVDDMSPNFIKQGYLFLKKQEEYKNAIDVLE